MTHCVSGIGKSPPQDDVLFRKTKTYLATIVMQSLNFNKLLSNKIFTKKPIASKETITKLFPVPTW